MKRIFLASLALLVAACTDSDKGCPTCEDDLYVLKATGQAYYSCLPSDGSALRLQFDTDTSAAPFAGRFSIYPGIPLDSLREGVQYIDTVEICGPNCWPSHVDLTPTSIRDGRILGTFNFHSVYSSFNTEGIVTLDIYPDQPSCMP